MLFSQSATGGRHISIYKKVIVFLSLCKLLVIYILVHDVSDRSPVQLHITYNCQQLVTICPCTSLLRALTITMYIKNTREDWPDKQEQVAEVKYISALLSITAFFSLQVRRLTITENRGLSYEQIDQMSKPTAFPAIRKFQNIWQN